MTLAVTQTRLLVGRATRTLSRQPAYLAFSLLQPMLWLLLFGQLFKRIGELPQFGTGSYLEYLTPGVVVMTAMMNAAWAGTSFVQDMERGVMDRTLASPVRRGALIAASTVYQALTTVVVAAIVFGIGLAAGARYPHVLLGAVVVLACSVLLAATFVALSNAMALLLRQQEALIGLSQFITLPLAFLSSVMMAPTLMPGWVASVARFNPVNWAAEGGREALRSSPEWTLVLRDGGLLAGLAVLASLASLLAFRRYQRSI